MSVTITTDVFCDVCTHWAHYCTGARSYAADAYRSAKSNGWTIRSRHSTCPKCNGIDPDYWQGGTPQLPTVRK